MRRFKIDIYLAWRLALGLDHARDERQPPPAPFQLLPVRDRFFRLPFFSRMSDAILANQIGKKDQRKERNVTMMMDTVYH